MVRITVKVGPTAVPVGPLTMTGPVDELGGTVTVICVLESIVKLTVDVVLKVTVSTELKLNPVIVTVVPIGPTFGLMAVTNGPLPNASVLSVKVAVEANPQLSVAVTVMVKAPALDGSAVVRSAPKMDFLEGHGVYPVPSHRASSFGCRMLSDRQISAVGL